MAKDIGGLFEDVNLDGILDAEEIINIDMDGIEQDAITSAKDLINNLSRYYYNDEFLKNNPSLKKRIDGDLEHLRILIKMRKSDEVTHDILIKAISKNSSNASLYRSLSEIQKTILQITTKMTEIVNSLNALLKNYQLEINFKEEKESNEDQEESIDDMQHTSKGSKSFIEQMMKDEENEEDS